MKKQPIAVVGAGFSGAVIARELAEHGMEVRVFDQRRHIAGNCHTEKDEATGIMIHKYGPHIFHTDDEAVWNYVNRFAEFYPYINRVKATVKDRVYSLPINLHTINQFFGKSFSPEQAKAFIAQQRDNNIQQVSNFEEQALKFVGKELYQAFFQGYTRKQWGVSPKKLPASILKRLPLRFNYDDNYFNHRFQGIPNQGYTHLIQQILQHDKIILKLGIKFHRAQAKDYLHVFNSGAIDDWFDYQKGSLGYRTLDFDVVRSTTDIQGCAVMNYPDEEIPYTRIVEHKYFTPWERFKASVAFVERSRGCTLKDIPYYPIRLVTEMKLLKDYITLAREEKNISFVGRLGTYRYLDMDVTIKEALSLTRIFLDRYHKSQPVPVFFNNPL